MILWTGRGFRWHDERVESRQESTDAEEEPLFVARALRPEENDEGTRLKHGMLQHEVIQNYRERRGNARLCASGFLMSGSSI